MTAHLDGITHGAPAGSGQQLPAAAPRPAGVDGDAFRLQFSKHAAKRLEQRGLDLDAVRLERLNRAVDQAEAKGSRDSVILLDELALVVSVQNRTIVTAMGDSDRGAHVFTNIDSVVIAS
jgi:flagellar operon protein